MYLSFKCKFKAFDRPAPEQQDASHQTLLPEQKTLVVCWHVDLENIKNIKP